MGQNSGRIGRRRRVLNEELLAADSALRSDRIGNRECEPGDTPRYGAGANVENHPQVTDFVPRRFRWFALVAILGLSTGCAAEMVIYYAEWLSGLSQVLSSEEITTLLAGRLVAWTTATVLLATACYARLIFTLRRHRVDDVRGRYRIWQVAALVAAGLSLNAVVNVHEPLARLIKHFTGWQLLDGHILWWLVPSAGLGGWLLVKLIADSAHCRSALMAYGLALGCFVASSAGTLSGLATWLPALPDAASRALPLATYWLLLSGTLLYARYLVLDVQGLIEHRVKNRVKHQGTAARRSPTASSLAGSPAGQEGSSQKMAAEWIDGTEPENDKDAENESPRRLSKAERKRLRKQKYRRPAA
ncbi:MAG: hypothetical protein MK171_08340 [Pirellulales bacterium]|nr:hypothetical protein [Pirellulales bacterium]